MKRDFIVKIPYSTDCRSVEEGKMVILGIMKLTGFPQVEIEEIKSNRTKKQSDSLHLWFALLADALNEAGMDMKKVIREEVDIPWTKDTVKENLWKPVQKAYLEKESTKDITTDEVDKVWNIVNKIIGERTGVYVPFPSEENERNA